MTTGLTGCIPPRLRDVPDNDLDQLGLPFCPLSPPEASTISSVTSEMDSLTISWATPLSDGGSDITAYDLRHIETDDDETVDLQLDGCRGCVDHVETVPWSTHSPDSQSAPSTTSRCGL